MRRLTKIFGVIEASGKVKRNLIVCAMLGIFVGTASGCYYSGDRYDRGYYGHGYSLRSFHDDTDHRIDQD